MLAYDLHGGGGRTAQAAAYPLTPCARDDVEVSFAGAALSSRQFDENTMEKHVFQRIRILPLASELAWLLWFCTLMA